MEKRERQGRQEMDPEVVKTFDLWRSTGWVHWKWGPIFVGALWMGNMMRKWWDTMISDWIWVYNGLPNFRRAQMPYVLFLFSDWDRVCFVSFYVVLFWWYTGVFAARNSMFVGNVEHLVTNCCWLSVTPFLVIVPCWGGVGRNDPLAGSESSHRHWIACGGCLKSGSQRPWGSIPKYT